MKRRLLGTKESFGKPYSHRLQKILWVVLFLSTPIWAIGQSITGKVINEQGEGLTGATVIVKGTTTGAITESDGSFTIQAAEGSVLLVTYIGYLNQEVTVAGSAVTVTMVEDVTTLDEVVVTGYSSERKKDLLGAVSVIDVDAIEGNPNPNALQAIQGRSPGVFVATGGDPGQGTSVRIRGISTLGNNDPLYIVDGVPVQPFQTNENGAANTSWDLSWLNPNDIESIQVLKDASSASIYGSRASNGVVIITTKQPNKNKTPKITFNARYSIENWNLRDQLTNSEERAIVEWQGAVNDGTDPNATGVYTYEWHLDPSLGSGIQGTGVPVLDRIIYPEWLDEEDQLRPAGHPNSIYGGSLEEGVNYWDEVAQTGIVQNYDLSFSQGNERGGVQFSANYFDQKGVVINTNYERISLRLNSNYNFLDGRITVGQNVSVSNGKRRWLDVGFGGDPANGPYRYKSILPVRTEDGRFSGPPGGGFSDRDNPVALSEDNKDDRIDNVKVFGNLFASIEILKGLNLRSNLGVDYDQIFSKDIFRTYSRGFLGNSIAELSQRQLHQVNWVFNNTLTYNTSFGNSNFSALLGTEAVKNTITNFSASAREFALETVDYFQLDAASGERTSTGGSTGFSLFSYFGKINYSLADKYLASFTIRRDGSSRFGINNRFAVFPAASLGWRLSEEAFIQNMNVFSNLKLRAAWGQTGNQDILNDARFGLYRAVYAPQSTILPWGSGCAQAVCPDAATSYDIGNNNSGILPSGFLATQTGNPNLRWESQTEINLGVDFGLWEQRISGSFEVFQKTTEDILIQPTAIAAFGDGANRFANGADMETNGWELGITYNSAGEGDLFYSITTNFSAYNAIITSLPEDLWTSYPGNAEQNIIGQAPNALFGFRTDGIFQNEEEVAAHADQTGKRIGSLRYVDLNNDGVINALDQEYGGANGVPDLEYGVNAQVSWKNFDFSLFIWGMLGRDVTPDVFRMENGSLINGENGGVFQLDSWTPTNTDTHIPAASNSLNPFGFSLDYNVRNGDFLAFRQASLGYSFPQDIAGGVFSNLRVYFTGENLGWIVDKSGPNQFVHAAWAIEPNVGIKYPRPLRLSLGLTAGF